MTATPPIRLVYEGEGEFQAKYPAWIKISDKNFVIGQQYEMVEHHPRSGSSHAHQFAAIDEAWANLAPEQVEMWPSAEHFRHYLLIKTGWCTSRTFLMANGDEANKLRHDLKSRDPFTLVLTKGDVVTVYNAKSQSYRAMSKDDFQASKTAVLAEAANILGTTPAELEKHAGISSGGKR